MNYYECKDTIAARLDEYLQTILIEKGLVVKQIVIQHHEIVSQFKDIYSRALLMQGLPKEEAPTFSNVPSTSFKWDIGNKLEEVFQALQLPSTQQHVHKLVQQLRLRSLTDILSEEQLANLEQVSFIKEAFSKASSWLVPARTIVAGMSANSPLLATITEEEKIFSKLLEFDWYYDYSDDNSIWRGGKAIHAERVTAIRAALVENPALINVVTVISNAANIPVTFFTELR